VVNRYRTLDCPLFPGYVFCRIDLASRLPVLTTPGFLYIVGAGSVPTPVDEAEIARIQAVVHSGLPVLPWLTPVLGQEIRFACGPLSGLQGILMQVGKQNRVYVGVTLLSRGVTVEADAAWIRPIGPPH
jgi:transcription antitermination factor NusG